MLYTLSMPGMCSQCKASEVYIAGYRRVHTNSLVCFTYSLLVMGAFGEGTFLPLPVVQRSGSGARREGGSEVFCGRRGRSA